jgi:hypothetical protein
MFSFGDEDGKEDKSNYAKFMDTLWRDYDNALLEPISTVTHGCGEVINLLLHEYHLVFSFVEFLHYYQN